MISNAFCWQQAGAANSFEDIFFSDESTQILFYRKEIEEEKN